MFQGFPLSVQRSFANWRIDGACFLLLTSTMLQSAMELEPGCAEEICEARSKLNPRLQLGIW